MVEGKPAKIKIYADLLHIENLARSYALYLRRVGEIPYIQYKYLFLFTQILQS